MAKIVELPGMGSRNDPQKDNEEKAQELVYDAWDNDSAVARKRLARKALELDPYCVDAYCILADAYQSIDKKKEYYTKGIEAFTKRYGAEYFAENTGYFWGLVETRPYMRLCAGYGDLLWETGEREAAIAQYEALLELNPNDNQGLRYSLINWLLAMGESDKAGKFLKKYNDENTFILFSKLLFIIKTESANTKKFTAAYRAASGANPLVTPYLLGRKKLPGYIPEYYSPGDDNEAITYCLGAKAVWEEDETAMTILQNLADKWN